jgi:hypothetical protein
MPNEVENEGGSDLWHFQGHEMRGAGHLDVTAIR